MRKIFLLTWVTLLVTACSMNAQEVNYTVKGTCAGKDTKVTLINQFTGKQEAETIAKNGNFTFEGTAGKDALMGVQEEGSDWQQLFFCDDTPVTIDLKNKTTKGSALNEKMAQKDMELSAMFNDVNNTYAKASDESLPEAKRMVFLSTMQQKLKDLGIAYLNIFIENKDNMMPVAFLNMQTLQIISMTLGEDALNQVFNSNAVYSHHQIYRKLKTQIDEMEAKQKAEEEAKNAIIGQQFTDLQEPDTDGKMHKLSEYVGKGKWVLIDFWASWCGPCRAEMPNVVAAYEKYHSKGFEVVGLSFDEDKDDWVQAIQNLKMPWIHLSDLKGWETAAGQVYNIHAIPASLLVDPTGKIVARDLRGEALGAKLQEIFRE